MKKQKGIALVSLVITIMVLIILASVATHSGIHTINSSKLSVFTAELKIMQTEVNELYQKMKNEEKTLIEGNEYTVQEILDTFGTNVSSIEDEHIDYLFTINEEMGGSPTGVIDKTGYYLLNQENLEKIGVEGVKQEVLVNIEKRKVISYNGLKYEGVFYYALEQLPKSIYNVEYEEIGGVPTFDISAERIKNNKWKITVSNIQFDGNINKWEVKYQKDGEDYWYTSEDLSFIINDSGKYKFKIKNGNIESEEKELLIKFQIGDYIDYRPDNNMEEYSSEKLSEAITGSSANTSNIYKEDLDWQILRIYNDGSIDLIGTPMTQNIYLEDAEGYNNGVYIINDICKTLYSRGNIEARSVNLEDFEFDLTEEGRKAKQASINNIVKGLSVGENIAQINTENNTVTYNIPQSYYPNIYEKENGSGVNTTAIKTNGIKDIETLLDENGKAKYDASVGTNAYKQATNGLTVTQTYYNIPIDNINYNDVYKVLSSEVSYWVASRCINCYYINYAIFGMRRMSNKGIGGHDLFESKITEQTDKEKVRPVVHLGAEVKIQPSIGENNVSNTHIITQY